MCSIFLYSTIFVDNIYGFKGLALTRFDRVPPCRLVAVTLDRGVTFAWAPLVDNFASSSLLLLFTIAAFREPAWHRRLRSKRSWARNFLKQPWYSLKRKADLTKQAIRRLRFHHGSHIPWHVMSAQGNEQWLCPCLPGGAKNGPNRNYCSQCGYHYSKVQWWTSSKNRTRTRSQSRRKKDKKKQVEPTLKLADGTETSLLQPFGEGDLAAATPWVTTTPSRTVKALTQFSPKNADNKKLSLEPPPEEVPGRLAQLKQKLREKGVEDTEILNDLEELEKASKDGPPSNQLTHKSLSQLQKAERSLEVIQKQTQDLDAHWKKWSEYMKTKFEEQGKLYLEKRKLLSEKKKDLGAKITTLREEIQKAAQAQQTKPIDLDDWKPPEVLAAFTETVFDISASEDEKDKDNPMELDGKKLKNARPVQGASSSPAKAARTA